VQTEEQLRRAVLFMPHPNNPTIWFALLLGVGAALFWVTGAL
jgi:hypothetical protein